jgi:hypothetical protein
VRHEVLQLKSDSARFVESIMAEVAAAGQTQGLHGQSWGFYMENG